jgi:hypothetical protein
MYDMPLRDYDPAIGRWVVQDPVIHHSQSTYSSFNGNPVLFADPTGGKGETLTDENGCRKFDDNGNYIPRSERVPPGEVSMAAYLGGGGATTAPTAEDVKKNEGILVISTELDLFFYMLANKDVNLGGKKSILDVIEELTYQADKGTGLQRFVKRENGGEVFIGANPNAKSDEGLFIAFRNSKPMEDFIFWISHGSPTSASGLNAVQFDAFMMKNSELYRDAVKNGKEITVVLMSCLVGVDIPNGFAKELSHLRKNIKFWGPDTYCYPANKILGPQMNRPNGVFNVWKNGIKIYDRTYGDLEN